ncbi:MAG: Rrf2 family transcriptional regulator [Candidatus Omnitrophota bacterium]|nr:Rrf2 family transcriptional regulator [Candidatus Omnitrophota bacterium]
MIYSKTCEYAIRALSYISSKGKGVFTMIPEVGRETGVPGPYVAKIFQGLVRNGILNSRRGPGGGFSMNKAPEQVSLWEIVEAIDDSSSFKDDCVMGLNDCSSASACPLHEVWDKARAKILDKLRSSTLKQLTGKNAKFEYRALKRSRLSETLQLGILKELA